MMEMKKILLMCKNDLDATLFYNSKTGNARIVFKTSRRKQLKSKSNEFIVNNCILMSCDVDDIKDIYKDYVIGDNLLPLTVYFSKNNKGEIEEVTSATGLSQIENGDRGIQLISKYIGQLFYISNLKVLDRIYLDYEVIDFNKLPMEKDPNVNPIEHLVECSRKDIADYVVVMDVCQYTEILMNRDNCKTFFLSL